jgi:hypothetical protein
MEPRDALAPLQSGPQQQIHCTRQAQTGELEYVSETGLALLDTRDLSGDAPGD